MNITSTFRLWLAAAVVAGAVMAASAPSNAQVSPEAAVTRTVGGALQWGPCPPIFPSGCQIAVLHGDMARPNADVFLRVPGGYRIPAHSHSSPERMVLVEGRLNVHYKGTPATLLTPGEYAYGPATLAHEATCLGKKPCTLFIAFEGPVDADAFKGRVE